MERTLGLLRERLTNLLLNEKKEEECDAKRNAHSRRALTATGIYQQKRLPLRYTNPPECSQTVQRHVSGSSANINGGALFDLYALKG